MDYSHEGEPRIEQENTILLIDDEDDFRWAMGNILRAVGYRVIHAQNGRDGLDLMETNIPNLVLLDYRMPDMDGFSVAAEMKKRFIVPIPIIMITGYGDVSSAVRAMKLGIYDYVTKPFDNNELLFMIKRVLGKQNLEREIAKLKKVLKKRKSLYDLMGSSDPVKKLIQHVEKVAPTMFTVLIEGESGTGKELIARAIHDLSDVRQCPFVALDCSGIPETLIESELFGYMRGAFTGADTDKPGYFELANGGTLFLDEVGNITHSVQQKLLRIIQERMVHRLGGKKPIPVDVRIITATNRTLKKDIESGDFRTDLYFRLNDFLLLMPALRERMEDIPYLSQKFMVETEEELKKKCGGFSKEALQSILSYHWPGNVRELRNIVRQAVLLCEENMPIQKEHLIFNVCLLPIKKGNLAISNTIYDDTKSLKEIVKINVEYVENRIISLAMEEAKGNKSQVARKLGINYKTLLRKIKAQGVC